MTMNRFRFPLGDLDGPGGNAFALLSRFQREARKAGWSNEEVAWVVREATSGDYDHLLKTLRQYSDDR
jgi:hypothetical protein